MMLDKQIRSLIEYDVKHIKMNNGFFFFLPTSFLAVEKWYGQRMKLGSQVIWYHKRIAALYDSYALFDTMTDSSAGQGEPRSGGAPSRRCASVLVRERANGCRRRVTLARMKGKRADTADCLQTAQHVLRRRNGRRAGRGYRRARLIYAL